MSILGRSDLVYTADDTIAGNLVAGTYSLPLNRPNWGDTYQELTWYIYVNAVNGAPTTGSLVASMYGVVPHTTGAQYLNEYVFALDTNQQSALTAEGVAWPNPICTQATSFPTAVQRTYRGFGKDLRLQLVAAFTGGTVPSFSVTVVIHGKG